MESSVIQLQKNKALSASLILIEIAETVKNPSQQVQLTNNLHIIVNLMQSQFVETERLLWDKAISSLQDLKPAFNTVSFGKRFIVLQPLTPNWKAQLTITQELFNCNFRILMKTHTAMTWESFHSCCLALGEFCMCLFIFTFFSKSFQIHFPT